MLSVDATSRGNWGWGRGPSNGWHNSMFSSPPSSHRQGALANEPPLSWGPGSGPAHLSSSLRSLPDLPITSCHGKPFTLLLLQGLFPTASAGHSVTLPCGPAWCSVTLPVTLPVTNTPPSISSLQRCASCVWPSP